MNRELVANETALHVKHSGSHRIGCSGCGAPLIRHNSGYCRKCHAAYMRRQRAIFRKWWEAEGRAAFERWKESRS